jgi:hypothetical protein
MSSADAKSDKRPNGKEAGPIRSFDGPTLDPGAQIDSFRIERELACDGAITFEMHSLWCNQRVTQCKMSGHIGFSQFERVCSD